MTLQELRGLLLLSQADVGNNMDVSQSMVSKTEHRDDVLVSTLQRYLSALGAELEIRAVFSNDVVVIDQFK